MDDYDLIVAAPVFNDAAGTLLLVDFPAIAFQNRPAGHAVAQLFHFPSSM
jgi:hypothetical protein